ncbi:putative fatty acyl-CoA reductase CG8306 [Haematobia irritans]|uniref:putative fatty acyl-CoA reductase CG8306 n=1 Tax=Haematobia irritans TaxID=7368 RepID=UPI003F50AE5C
MIPEFFENREIFLTGGSGIIGKALIDKLLRSCNVGKIYVLLRTKRNASVDIRLQQMKNDKIFRRLKTQKPNEFDNKVVPIAGDIAMPMLGISPADVKLMENVSVVYHSAATVRFNEPILNAIQLNLGGTYEAIQFAETLKKLDSFVYISTFFSNPYLEFVDTKVYDPPMDWKFCLNLIKRKDISYETMDILTSKLVVGFINTYCFTKNLTESMVNEYRHKLPVSIFKPSIVVQALEDPEPGFPTALTGALGLFTLVGAGILKSLYCSQEVRLDICPLDVNTKSLLYYTVRSYKTHTNATRPSSECPVYICSSCTHYPITLRESLQLVMNHRVWEETPLIKSLLLPGVHFTENEMMFRLMFFIYQMIPALFADLIVKLKGSDPVFLKIQRKVFITLDVMKPYMFHSYKSHGVSYVNEMWNELKGTDFDISVWKDMQYYNHNIRFTCDFAIKARDVLMDEDPSTLPLAKILLKIKKLSYHLFLFFMAYKMYDSVLISILTQ